MIYVVDSANVAFIAKMVETYNIQGVTTNPTIICREKTEYIPLLKEIEKTLGNRDFHIQLTKETYPEMIAEARELAKIITNNLHIKIPVSTDGLKAIKTLSDEGLSITATAVCTLNQGLMAALQGADYVAVYVNRISNSGMNGNQVVEELKDEYLKRGITTEIIGASYKSVYQVNESIICGADQVTVGMDLFEKLFFSDITDYSVKQFTIDFNNQYNMGE